MWGQIQYHTKHCVVAMQLNLKASGIVAKMVKHTNQILRVKRRNKKDKISKKTLKKIHSRTNNRYLTLA